MGSCRVVGHAVACGVTGDRQAGPNSTTFYGRESVGASGRERVIGRDRDPVG